MDPHQKQKIEALQRHLAALSSDRDTVDVKKLAELFDLTVFITRRIALFAGFRPTEENEELFAEAESVTIRLTRPTPEEG